MDEFDVRATSEYVYLLRSFRRNQRKLSLLGMIRPSDCPVSQLAEAMLGAIGAIINAWWKSADSRAKAVLVVSFELDEILNVSDKSQLS